MLNELNEAPYDLYVTGLGSTVIQNETKNK